MARRTAEGHRNSGATLVHGTPVQATRLRAIRTRLGLKFDIDQNGVSDAYDASHPSMRLDFNSFSLTHPVEFDFIFLHVFPQNAPQAISAFMEIKEESEKIRYIDLNDDEDEDNTECITDKADELINKHKDVVKSSEWLANLEVGYGFGNRNFDVRRLSLWEPYWLFTYRQQKDEILEKISSVFDLCALSRMGYSQNVTDHVRQARHILSWETVNFPISTRFSGLPEQKVTLEIALDGILYAPV